MLKSMLVNKDFQTWHLIGSTAASQSEAMLENPNMEFNRDFT